jgi:hypothetical protein
MSDNARGCFAVLFFLLSVASLAFFFYGVFFIPRGDLHSAVVDGGGLACPGFSWLAKKTCPR